MEEYINGTIVSFDGVADSHCVPLFYTSNVFPTPLLDIVSQNGDLSYWTQKSVPAALKDVGFRTIKAFGAKSRFFHCEFFRLKTSRVLAKRATTSRWRSTCAPQAATRPT